MYLRSILFDLYQKKLKCDQLCKNILWPFRVSSDRNLSHSALGAMTFVEVCIFSLNPYFGLFKGLLIADAAMHFGTNQRYYFYLLFPRTLAS
jgi:hypothetical protein